MCKPRDHALSIKSIPRKVNLNNIRQIPRVSKISEKLSSRFALWNTRSMKNKTTHVCDLVISERLDILAVTEAWLTGDHRDNHVLADIRTTLPGHDIHAAPRLGRPGGGVCIIFRKEFVTKEHVTWRFEAFECVDLLITSTNQTSFRLSTIYRPPRSKKNPITMTQFFNDFSVLLEDLAVFPGRFAIVGDFNIHVDNLDDHDAQKNAQYIVIYWSYTTRRRQYPQEWTYARFSDFSRL